MAKNDKNTANNDIYIKQYIPWLNSVAVSELANILDISDNISDNTAFIAAICNNPADENKTYYDAKFTYLLLSNLIYDNMPKTEIMRHDTYEFAEVNHIHLQYDWFKVWPDFGKNGKNKSVEVSAVLANILFENDHKFNDIDICLPKIDFDTRGKFPRHYIGELMFVGAKSLNELSLTVGNVEDINSPDFCGWVFPDGRVINTKRFEYMEAKAAFGYIVTSTEFMIPNFEGFFKPVCQDGTTTDNIDYNIMVKNDGHNSVPVHTHAGIAMTGMEPISLDIKTSKSVPNGRGPYIDIPVTDKKSGVIMSWATEDFENNYTGLPREIPSGKIILDDAAAYFTADIKTPEFDLQAKNIKLKINDILVTEAGRQYNNANEYNTMSYPLHTVLPVLIYIGFPYNTKYTYWE